MTEYIIIPIGPVNLTAVMAVAVGISQCTQRSIDRDVCIRSAPSLYILITRHTSHRGRVASFGGWNLLESKDIYSNHVREISVGVSLLPEGVLDSIDLHSAVITDESTQICQSDSTRLVLHQPKIPPAAAL